MSHTKDQEETRLNETARLEAFSDGVFAIAITLLVLELIQILHVQKTESLFEFCIHHWQPFFAFLIGFLTILICWINHHHVFTFIRKTDSRLPWVNGFVLLMITFTPFPTAILAEFLETEGKFAVAIFGFNYFMIGVTSYWLCAYSYNKFLINSTDREVFHFIKLTYGYGVIYTFVAFLICFISIPVAIALYLILFFVFAFPKEFAIKLLERKQKMIKKAALRESK